MEIKSRVTRLAGLLCVASALQGFPVISSTNPGGIISVTQQGTYHLTGTIVDGYGEPVIGANIVEKGTTNGTVTDIDGKFSLEVAPDAVLTISFIGYIPKEITLKGEKELKVVLMEDTQTLDEVVVVGYGTQKKVNLTGAVEQVTSEVFDNRSVPNVTQALQGSIPNLNIQLTDGKPTRSASYNVRGTTSIGQGGSALVLIDGVEGDPSMLNPNDIASVSVLKDAASAAIYGARGTFGVVLITTKEPTKDKTSITYSGNFAMQKPVTVPDFVTDGYEYASHFYEAYHAWNNYSADPKNINKTQEFSLGWLEDFKNRKEQGITDEVTVDATGKYVYYGNEDYYDALYKKTTFAQDHNLSVTGNNGKLNYYVSGRFYGYDGLFRYNTDDYKMMNLRAKGSVQVFDWLKIENNMDFSNMYMLEVMTKQGFEEYMQESIPDISDGSVAIMADPVYELESIVIGDDEYPVEQTMKIPGKDAMTELVGGTVIVIVKDETALEKMRQQLSDMETAAYGEDRKVDLTYMMNFDMSGSVEEKIACANAVREHLNEWQNDETIPQIMRLEYNVVSRAEGRIDYESSNGGLFFLGLFLGSMFLMITVLIIYYKQISEGYEDKERFAIMEKVGMSNAEVKASIRSQVRTVFFLPLVTAACHLAAAYPMLKKMLALAWNGITSFSVKPIDFITALGGFLIFLCVIAAVYALVSYCNGHTVPGWTSLILSIWFLGGMQLVAIGMIGQYIGKIYIEVKHRPRYNVETYLNHDNE